MWIRVLYAWLGFLYPPHCVLCKTALSQNPGLCSGCAEMVGCATPEKSVGLTLNGVDIFVLKEFNDPIRELVHMLKYQGKTLPGRLLGRALGQSLAKSLDAQADWVVVPVPLHSARKRERGYNQSAVIARALGGELGLETREKVIKRVRHTPSQTKLDRQARAQNVDTAFRVRQGQFVKGRRIVLVDDVVTTGATVCACAKVLMLEGAKQVVVAAVARPKWGEDDLQCLASEGDN